MFDFVVATLAFLMFIFGTHEVLKAFKKIVRTQHRILRVLERIEDLLTPVEQKAVVIEFYEVVDGELKRVTMPIQSIEETKKYKIVAKDKAGNEAKLDGQPQIAFADPAVADIALAEDGTFDVVPKGPIGDVELQVLGDALIGEGTEEIFGKAMFTFTAGKAVSIEVVPV